MKHLVIFVFAAAIVGVSIAVWFALPAQKSAIEERQACQAVYDQLRRQIADPAFAQIDSCEQATIVPGEPDSYLVTAYFVSGGNRYMFVGQAWRTNAGWEATVNSPNQVGD